MADDRVTIFGGRPVFGRAPAQGELLVGDGAGLTLVDVGISEAAGVVTFSRPLKVDGTIESTTGGFVFPDGSTQTTAMAAPSNIADDRILANISGAPAQAAANALTDILDAIVGTDRGSLLVRGDTTWAALAPGASGTVLQSQGAGADLFWNGGFSHNTADQSITSTTTLTDITDLSFPVEANKVYRFRATVIIYADAGGFIVSVNGPASPTRVDFGFVGLSGAVTTYGTTATSSAGAINAMPAIQGVIHNGANAGTVALQFRQSSSNAAATTVKSGSWIEWREIT